MANIDREMLADIVLEIAEHTCPNNKYDDFKKKVLDKSKEKGLKIDTDDILDILDIEGLID